MWWSGSRLLLNLLHFEFEALCKNINACCRQTKNQDRCAEYGLEYNPSLSALRAMYCESAASCLSRPPPPLLERWTRYNLPQSSDAVPAEAAASASARRRISLTSRSASRASRAFSSTQSSVALRASAVQISVALRASTAWPSACAAVDATLHRARR